MSVFDILTMIGGLALFLYGMEVMGNGLSKASGGRMERILEKMTDNIFKAVSAFIIMPKRLLKILHSKTTIVRLPEVPFICIAPMVKTNQHLH